MNAADTNVYVFGIRRQYMPVSKHQGVVRGHSIVLDKSAKLRDGTRVLVTPVNEVRGSPAAILAALAQTPTVNCKDVDELERVIEVGKRPLSTFNPFTPKLRRKKA
jgi:hypothetical protein